MTYRTLVGLFGVALAAASPGAYAATPAAADVRGDELVEVVVTATRRAEPVQSVPLSITAISGADLVTEGVTATRDLVAVTPNLAVQGSYTREQPEFFIRGIGNTQFNPNGNSKVGVYLDDTYLNSTAAQGAGLFDIGQVEIARGPQGYLFGQNTTGGLIHVIPNKPQIGGGLTGEGDVTVGRFNELDPALAIGFDTGATSAARISVSDQNRNGISENTLLSKREGAVNLLAWRAQWLWKAGDAVDVLVNVHGSRDRSGIVAYKQVGLINPATGGPCPAPGLGSGCIDPSGYADNANFYQGQWNVRNQHAWVDAAGASLTVNWQLPAFKLTSVSAYEQNTSRIHEDTDAGPADILRGDYLGHPRQFSEELRLTSPEQQLSWLAGLYYFHEDLDTSVAFLAPGFGPGIFTGNPSDPLEGVGQVSSLTTNSYAAFGNIDYAATERWKLSLGLRATHETKELSYDAYIIDATSFPADSFVSGALIPAAGLAQTIGYRTSQSWNNVSGRASVSYKLADRVLGYVSFARGFNGGNYNGGAFLNQGEASLVNPEILKSYELGLKTEPTPRLRVNADVFKYQFTDMQVFISATSGANVFQQLSNAAAASLYGAELEIDWKPIAGWVVQLGSGYTHSRFDNFQSSISGDLTGKTLPSAPKLNVNGLVRYSVAVPGGTLDLQVDGKYQSSQFFSVNDDPLLRQDAYGIYNARISYAVLKDRLTLSLWGKNLADKGYLVGAYDLAIYGWDQYNVGEPRTYGVTVQYRMP
jgi:iron complex outermembrane recepter protein